MADLHRLLTRKSGRIFSISLIGASAAAVGVVMTARGSDQPVASAIPAVAAPGPAATLLVFVSGAVAHPGLYELAVGGRIADAIADAGGIQFRVLNRRKGPAVRGPRTQADRKLYAAAMQAEIRETPDLDVIEAEVDDLLANEHGVVGVKLAEGSVIHAGAVVLTTGTFLSGLIHIGEKQIPLRPGSCFHLPPEQVHCIENNGSSVMRIMGVFHPSGDPASRSYDEATKS